MSLYIKGYVEGLEEGYKKGVLVENENIVNDLNTLLDEIKEKTPIGFLLVEGYINKAIKQFKIKNTP